MIYSNSKIGKSLQVHLDRLDFCEEIAKQSDCLSRHVGAILVKDNGVVATGYNRAPCNTTMCENCIRHSKHSGESLDICKAIHAEEILCGGWCPPFQVGHGYANIRTGIC